jgi:ribose transport system substrate-binding protein
MTCKRSGKFLGALVTCATVLAGSTGIISAQPSAATPKAGIHITIGFLQQELGAPYFKAMEVIAASYAKEHGFSIVFENANLDPVTQLDQASDLVGRGVQALVIDAVGGPSEKDYLLKIATKVPVVFEDNGIPGVGVATVQADNYNNGFQSGKMTGERFKLMGYKRGSTITMLSLHGMPGDVVVGPAREGGFFAGLKSEGFSYKIEGQADAEYNEDQAVPATEDMLARYPHPDLILANNDSMGLGALTVLKDDHNTTTLIAAASDGQKQALALMMPSPIGEGCHSQYISTGLNSPTLATIGGLKIAFAVASGQVKASSVKKLVYTKSSGIDCHNVKQFYNPKSIF